MTPKPGGDPRTEGPWSREEKTNAKTTSAPTEEAGITVEVVGSAVAALRRPRRFLEEVGARAAGWPSRLLQFAVQAGGAVGASRPLPLLLRRLAASSSRIACRRLCCSPACTSAELTPSSLKSSITLWQSQQAHCLRSSASGGGLLTC